MGAFRFGGTPRFLGTAYQSRHSGLGEPEARVARSSPHQTLEKAAHSVGGLLGFMVVAFRHDRKRSGLGCRAEHLTEGMRLPRNDGDTSISNRKPTVQTRWVSRCRRSPGLSLC